MKMFIIYFAIFAILKGRPQQIFQHFLLNSSVTGKILDFYKRVQYYVNTNTNSGVPLRKKTKSRNFLSHTSEVAILCIKSCSS